MLDLFGEEVTTYRGKPIERVTFTRQEADEIADEVLFGGLLIEQFAADLKKIKRLSAKGDTKINDARREAWAGLMWCFDLWEVPAHLPFDTACQLVGADSEVLRAAISVEFGDEIRAMVTAIKSRFPEEKARMDRLLGRYIDLSIH